MILAPVLPVAPSRLDTPVTVRLIGMLDRVLVESFSDACAGLTAPGFRTLIVVVRDVTVMRNEDLDRFLATLSAYRAAGHRVFVNGTPAWRKIAQARTAAFPESTQAENQSARRQIILCHSSDKRGAA